MSYVELRPGNSYPTTPTVTLTDDTGVPFPLSGATYTLVATGTAGQTYFTHTLTIDDIGTTTLSDGLAVGTGGVSSGVVVNSISAVESAAMSGWVHWTLSILDSTGNTDTVECGDWYLGERQCASSDGITRRDLRLRIGRRLGDVVVLTATATADDTSTFVDAVSMSVATDNLKGRQFVCASGPNAGHVARITGQTDSAGLLTFTPAATVPYATGDVLHVYNKNSRGWTVDEYNAAIDSAIEDAHPLSVKEIVSDIVPDFDAAGSITVPPNVTEVYQIETGDDSNGWHTVRRAGQPGGYGWSVNPGQGTIRISDMPGSYASGQPVRLWGYARHQPLDYEQDRTDIVPEWLVARACYHLVLGGMDREQTRSSMVLIYRDESVAWKPRIRTIRRSGSVKVR